MTTRRLIYLVLTLAVAGVFLAMAYVISLVIEFLPWANPPHTDGLFLIVVPLWLTPLSWIFLFFKWLAMRKLVIYKRRENHQILFAVAPLFISICVVIGGTALAVIAALLCLAAVAGNLIELKEGIVRRYTVL